MKIRKLVLLAINGHPDLKKQLQEVLKVSQPTMSRFMNQNSDELTKAAALRVIREALGLTDEQILEEDTVSEERN